MEDSRVVFAAETATNVRVRVVRQLAGEIHGELTGKGHGLGASLGAKVLGLDVIHLGDAPKDVLEGDQVFLRPPDVRQYLLGEVEGERATSQVAEGADA